MSLALLKSDRFDRICVFLEHPKLKLDSTFCLFMISFLNIMLYLALSGCQCITISKLKQPMIVFRIINILFNSDGYAWSLFEGKAFHIGFFSIFLFYPSLV